MYLMRLVNNISMYLVVHLNFGGQNHV